MPVYKVTVRDLRYVEYYVPAESEKEAKDLIECSDDADADFVHKTVDAEWKIQSIEEEK